MTQVLGLSSQETSDVTRRVFNSGEDVDCLYPFPAELARLAVETTKASTEPGVINPGILRAGLITVNNRVRREVSAQFGELQAAVPGASCGQDCGILEGNGPMSCMTRNKMLINLYIHAGVDKAEEDEPARPDEPIILADIQCFDAIELIPVGYVEPDTAMVEKMPKDYRLKSCCRLVMDSIALATFASFGEQIKNSYPVVYR